MNLIDLLIENAESSPDKVVYRFLNTNGEVYRTYTNKELLAASNRLAHYLVDRGLVIGERVILLFKSNDLFIPAILGCFMAGVVAVPVVPPTNQYLLKKFQGIHIDCNARIVLSEDEVINSAGKANVLEAQCLEFVDVKNIRCIATELPLKIRKSEIAFLQYTSGSTGQPKGVAVSHDNLIDNLTIIATVYGFKNWASDDVVFVSWLPLTHDMGLIGNAFEAIFLGGEIILMPSLSFLFNPLRWLNTIFKYRATISMGPNFSFNICCEKINENDLKGLDLSSWRVAVCGAELVSSKVAKKFIEKYVSYGFSEQAFYPSYGLAEATLCVSVKRGLSILHLDRKQLKHGRAVIIEDIEQAYDVVSCGKPALKTKIIKENVECSEGDIGEVWVSGGSVAQGYWQNDMLSHEIFQATLADSVERYLKTGDLGFLHQGELFVTGRIKELIIVNGVNYCPQDIEATVLGASVFLQGQNTIVFSVNDYVTERVVVMAEVMRHAAEIDYDDLASIIRLAVLKNHQLVVSDIVLLPRSRIPKTTSGKLQRAVCRTAYIEGKLNKLFKQDFIVAFNEQDVA